MKVLQVLMVGAVAVFAIGAGAAEWKTVEVEKYGYEFKIPAEFDMSGDLDKTTSWIYQPGAEDAGKSKKKSKSKTNRFSVGGGVGIGPLRVGASQTRSETESESGSGGSDLESALQVYVNWTWMPDVDSKTMFDTNLKSDRQNADSPDPDYEDIVVMTKENGYPEFEGGYAYCFKEVDKKDDGEIHRWHIKAFGNKSSYTIGLTGTYGQFKEWGPKFQEVIESFKLIPLEE